VGGISAEARDVPLHPLERGALVLQTSIGDAIGHDGGGSEEAEKTQSILDVDSDDATV
jgi:hypothetical protein